MVYAHHVTRVTLSGTSFTGAEIWTTGFFMGKENGDAEPPTSLMADKIRNYWSDYFQTTAAAISNTYQFRECKVARISREGNTDDNLVFYSQPATPVLGAVTTTRLPAQCSLVATLFTDRPRGKAAKGRMYLPGIATVIDSSGQYLSSTLGTNATALQTFFNAVNADVDIPDNVILAAKGTGPIPDFTAQNEPIIGIRLGSVIDTQRRRRNALVETYQERSVTAN